MSKSPEVSVQFQRIAFSTRVVVAHFPEWDRRALAHTAIPDSQIIDAPMDEGYVACATFAQHELPEMCRWIIATSQRMLRDYGGDPTGYAMMDGDRLAMDMGDLVKRHQNGEV